MSLKGMGYDPALTRPWSFDDMSQSTYMPQHFWLIATAHFTDW